MAVGTGGDRELDHSGERVLGGGASEHGRRHRVRLPPHALDRALLHVGHLGVDGVNGGEQRFELFLSWVVMLAPALVAEHLAEPVARPRALAARLLSEACGW